MSDILYDARLWLEGRPRCTRTHWDDCHLSSGHTECLVRKLLDEIELLRGYRDEAEADAAVARLLADRLRLTDAEREVLLWLAKVGGDTHPALKTVTPEMRPILQQIVKRLDGNK